MINQCIIIGGGKSLTNILDDKRAKGLNNKFTIGCNYAHLFLDCSVVTFVDKRFVELNPDIKNLPLKVTNVEGEEIYVKSVKEYNPNSEIKDGLYTRFLTGIFSLDLALKLGAKEIFLLGFDSKTDVIKAGEKTIYSNNFHRLYENEQRCNYNSMKNKINRYFSVFPKRNIYNVCLSSKLEQFEKLSINQFFNKLNSENYEQENIRQIIKQKIYKNG